jgi:hypothetical protein
MRLNPFYPSDDPMSSVFYCFGGGGDDGGGGDSRSEADRSYEDDFGFSSDLADKYSGSAADVGGRDDNGGDDRPAPASSAMIPQLRVRWQTLTLLYLQTFQHR